MCIRTGQELWVTGPMLYQLSYEVKSVPVGDIWELSLVPSISMYSKIILFVRVGVMYSGEYDVGGVTLCAHLPRES